MIESTGRVDLTWPLNGEAQDSMGSSAPSLAEIERAFREWIDEARRRGCSETAPVGTRGGEWSGHVPGFALVVVWDAGKKVDSNG